MKKEIPFLAVILCLGGGLLALKWAIYSQYGYQSDVFSYSRAITNTLNGRFMWDPVHTYLFGSHSYLFLLLFVPLYLIQSTPFWLIGSSVVAHVIASWFVCQLGSRLFSCRVIGNALGLWYIVNPFVIEHVVMPTYGFQPDVLAPPFIFAACFYLTSNREAAAFLSLVLLSSIKEEFALLALGLVALFAYQRLCASVSPKLDLLSVPQSISFRSSLAQILLLVSGCIACFAVSALVLKHGKTISEFHFAPSLSVDQIRVILSGSFLREAYNHLAFYLPSFLFLPILLPELLSVVVLRIGINLAVYSPNTPMDMSVGNGWCWGNVAVINLLFLGMVFGLRRLSVFSGIPDIAVRTVVIFGLMWNVWLLASPEALGFRSAIWLANDYVGKIPDAMLQRKKSVESARAALRRDGIKGLILVSPELMVDFPDQDTSVAQFALRLSPRLFGQAQAAVLLPNDTVSIHTLASDPNFHRIHEDKHVVVFKRLFTLQK
jgi:uncharacterized membrane protein